MGKIQCDAQQFGTNANNSWQMIELVENPQIFWINMNNSWKMGKMPEESQEFRTKHNKSGKVSTIQGVQPKWWSNKTGKNMEDKLYDITHCS